MNNGCTIKADMYNMVNDSGACTGIHEGIKECYTQMNADVLGLGILIWSATHSIRRSLSSMRLRYVSHAVSSFRSMSMNTMSWRRWSHVSCLRAAEMASMRRRGVGLTALAGGARAAAMASPKRVTDAAISERAVAPAEARTRLGAGVGVDGSRERLPVMAGTAGESYRCQK